MYMTKIVKGFCVVVTVLMDTWLDAFTKKSSQNMNSYVRWKLFMIGCLVLGVTLSIDAQLHWLVLLPLVSIYLIQTAVIGYEPFYCLIQRMGSYLHKHSLLPNPQNMSGTRTVIPK